MGFAIMEGLLGLGAGGSLLGLLLGSFFTLSPEKLNAVMTSGAVVAILAGLAAVVLTQKRGGPALYEKGSFHGYVLGIPEMEYALLMAVVFVGAWVLIPFFLNPAHLSLLRPAAVVVLVAAAVGASALAFRRRPKA